MFTTRRFNKAGPSLKFNDRHVVTLHSRTPYLSKLSTEMPKLSRRRAEHRVRGELT